MTTDHNSQISGAQDTANPSSLFVTPTTGLPASPSPLLVICAWCDRTITEGILDAFGQCSHGICTRCAQAHFPDEHDDPEPLYTGRQCVFCGAAIEPGNTPRGMCDGCRETSERNSMEGRR